MSYDYAEHARKYFTKHGGKAGGKVKRSYNAWMNMRMRCMNVKSKDYPYYGGRGICICKRWESYINFLEDMGEPLTGLTLDRIDVDGDYTPANCRWATRKEQSRNRAYCSSFTYLGRTLYGADWAYLLGLSFRGFNRRVNDHRKNPEVYSYESIFRKVGERVYASTNPRY